MILKDLLIKSATCNIRRKFLQTHYLVLCKNTRREMSSVDVNDVIVENFGDKGVITLNRPKALNALNLSMVNKILPVLRKWEKEKVCVIVKGAGDKAFCAGGDVRAVVEAGRAGNVKLGHEFFRTEYTTNGLIGTYKVPYIALIDGIVMGGGVGLSIHGRYRVATERTLFAMPETQIGLFPDVGGSYFLPRLAGKLGTFLALTGQRLRGADVFLAGIATHYVESFKLPELEQTLLKCTSEQNIKDTLAKFAAPVNQEFSLAPHLAAINRHFAAPSVEGIVASLEGDGSKWAQETAKLLGKMCPTSLKVALKELFFGGKMSLQDCLQMEYRLAVASLANTEFYEGVRALLIDKDQNPKWKPATIQEVTEELVDDYFKKLPDDQELRHKL